MSLRTEQKIPPASVCSERGGGWCLLIIPILIAPHFHPMSSCSWWQLGVLSWWWSSGIICHCCLSLLSVIVVCCCHCHVLLSFHCPHPHCTPFPPHEQLLMVAVGGAVLVVVLKHHRCWCVSLPLSSFSLPATPCCLCCLSSSHLQSTPQAVAHEARGRVCHFLFITGPIVVVIHLVSRGLQWQCGGAVNGIVSLL